MIIGKAKIKYWKLRAFLWFKFAPLEQLREWEKFSLEVDKEIGLGQEGKWPCRYLGVENWCERKHWRHVCEERLEEILEKSAEEQKSK